MLVQKYVPSSTLMLKLCYNFKTTNPTITPPTLSFSKSVRDHILGSMCCKNLDFALVHKDLHAKSLTYTKIKFAMWFYFLN